MLRRGNLNLTGVKVKRVRPLARDELQALKEPRPERPVLQKLREGHHAVARAIAMGMTHAKAARFAGYSVARVTMLTQSPAFQELIAYYRNLLNESFKDQADEYMELLTANAVKAERLVADKLNAAIEDDEILPTRELLAISRDSADRIGYGKKQTNLNVNVDFAAALERAIKRSGVNPSSLKVVSSPPSAAAQLLTVPVTVGQSGTVEVQPPPPAVPRSVVARPLAEGSIRPLRRLG